MEMTHVPSGSPSARSSSTAAPYPEPSAATEGHSDLQQMNLTSFGLPVACAAAGEASGEGGPPAGAVEAMAHRTPPEALPEVPAEEGGEAVRKQLQGADLTGWGLPPGGGNGSSGAEGVGGSGGVTGAPGGIATAGVEAVDMGARVQGAQSAHSLTGAFEAIRRTVEEGA
ncbi:hypothetical protein HYH02_004097 [Chlamydomonas schloesseri]|uniref:Uncharacterized protein n=1 Tax=Chlamydomonas schloesseri TaxID=2026947 RepID=A0A835WP84_9CHLO|nr:hypothetical protein HYH02_004097 [Chlamydomonas schloesseri]|eukprot:KAG2451499.1 hypothetical protein HYH02_004097 [Chlamydomonas schloesseri]